MKTWLTVAEGAAYSGVSRDTIYTACERREIRHVRVGRRAIRLKPEWIDAWLERHARCGNWRTTKQGSGSASLNGRALERAHIHNPSSPASRRASCLEVRHEGHDDQRRGAGTRRSRTGQRGSTASRDAARSPHRGRSCRSAAHDTTCDLRHDRASAIARRDSHPSASAPARGRPATLAGPEARAIAEGVNGDERESQTVSTRRLGGGHPRPAARRVASSGSAKRRRCRRSRRPNDGVRIVSGICSQHGPPSNRRRRCPHSESSRRGSWTATRGRIGRSRAGLRPRRRFCSVHLVPAFGHEDAGRDHERGRAAAEAPASTDRAPKTVNNVLTVLEHVAEESRGVGRDRADAVHDPLAADPERRRRGSTTSRSTSGWSTRPRRWIQTAYLIVLLGGEAGLRCGEMMALEWSDVDLGKRQLCVQRSDWKGHVTAPKGGRLRYVPHDAATGDGASRASASARARGCSVSAMAHRSRGQIVQDHVRRRSARAAQRRAGVHRLRHTFCSHLAMRGAPARAIQELAGHADLTTTQRYMHLSPAAIEGAIRLLDQPKPADRSWRHVGDGKSG